MPSYGTKFEAVIGLVLSMLVMLKVIMVDVAAEEMSIMTSASHIDPADLLNHTYGARLQYINDYIFAEGFDRWLYDLSEANCQANSNTCEMVIDLGEQYSF